jgi:hypothetical protein
MVGDVGGVQQSPSQLVVGEAANPLSQKIKPPTVETFRNCTDICVSEVLQTWVILRGQHEITANRVQIFKQNIRLGLFFLESR